MLLQQGGSPDEPPADENRFELVLKKLKGVAVGSFGSLQIPISFKAVSLEESSGQVHVCMDPASVSSLSLSEPLLWQYPIKVRACLPAYLLQVTQSQWCIALKGPGGATPWKCRLSSAT